MLSPKEFFDKTEITNDQGSDLDTDQHVMLSVAISLKRIADDISVIRVMMNAPRANVVTTDPLFDYNKGQMR